MEQMKQKLSDRFFWGGVGFTTFIALVGTALSLLPFFGKIGAMACAILLAILYRQLFGYPEKLRTGIEFVGKFILRFAIVLYGFKLNIYLVFNDGLGLLGKGILTIIFSIAVTMLIAKWLKADPMISLLLGIGTGICGAAAIAAASPIIQSKDEDTAISVGMIALIGTIFALGYTAILPHSGLSLVSYGEWSGISLHEIAHVALAGAAGGDDALTMALLAKLSRVLLLIPVCFILVFWMKRRTKKEKIQSKIPFPWFLLGFLLTSFIGTFGMEHGVISEHSIDLISTMGTFLLTMAMTGLGLNVSFQEMKRKALRPLIALLMTSLALSTIWYLLLT
ncbi:putative integral membrane protein (TIGR00698 family) [Oikeobacillus pervagus]|uniref:Integral membrane protein (TIGR00698 family) n=1 Tax=Oikeobacillus pervagus TaxID=1325931 RepID=A0AAJ1T1R6_9BACI|nr:putative sulfate exporter family transporter [Oikeobacillus pervagus]MDQ0215592.1 putative integral membrane protein (TIGR00698 family) [Oikeobacillus pervagus]